MSMNEQSVDNNVEDMHAERLREYAEKVVTMTKDELNEELEILNENLEDIQIEKRLIIGQTGVHINAVTMDSYRESFDREIASIEQKIRLVKEALGS
ncbi:MAG TPA: hypothetical protein VE439_11130 [Anaerolineae bacterium]|jgi:molybdopterin biosynthesis enzyme MoaB|nr:hypothetical protein [Anaerolineae bacterium]